MNLLSCCYRNICWRSKSTMSTSSSGAGVESFDLQDSWCLPFFLAQSFIILRFYLRYLWSIFYPYLVFHNYQALTTERKSIIPSNFTVTIHQWFTLSLPPQSLREFHWCVYHRFLAMEAHVYKVYLLEKKQCCRNFYNERTLLPKWT